MKATDLLKQDHEEVKQLFAEFESADSPEEKGDILEEIREQLTVHSTIEEELFYPAVKKVSSEGKSEIKEALEEHQEVKTMLEELDAMDPEDKEFAAKMKKLKQAVEHHVQEEEGEMFSTASELGNDKLTQLGDQLEERKEELMEEESGVEESESASH